MAPDTLTPPAHSPAATRPVGDDPRSAGASLSPAKIRLGEELPIFCEKCGYALHGLPQHRCPACDLLQFHCPECGHHQPINTLRPAFQKIMGRIRAFFLVLWVIFKLNFFGWLLVAWVAMGGEFSYSWSQSVKYVGGVNGGPAGAQRAFYTYTKEPAQIRWQEMIAFAMFGLAFGLIGRMLLLRWRRGYLVGAVLGTLAAAAIALGAYIESTHQGVVRHPYTLEFSLCIAIAAGSILLGASIVWGAWQAVTWVFLPQRTARALLDWQGNLSNRGVSDLSR
jgi:hypothetical protein